MKLQLVLLALLLFLPLASAYDLNACTGTDANTFGDIGNCMIRGVFLGDSFLFAMIMLLVFAIFLWQVRVPMGAALALGLVMLFGLSYFMPPDYYQTLLNLGVLVIGVMTAMAILHYVRR